MSSLDSKSISSVNRVFMHKDYLNIENKRTFSTGSSILSKENDEEDHYSFDEVAETSIETEEGSLAQSDVFEPTDHEKRGIICVLEDAVDQLEVLGRLLPHSFDKYDGYLTLEERYGDPEKTLVYPEEASTAVEDSLMKIQRDRSFAEAVFVRTVMEMEKTGMYGPLEEAILDVQQMKDDDEFLQEEMEANEQEVGRLKTELEELEEARRVAVEQSEWGIVHLKDQTHETMVEMSIRRRYVTSWEKSREEQRRLISQTEERRLKDNIRQLYTDMDTENRVNQEIETYISMTKQDLEDSIERWMELYDNECEERDQAILKLKMEREVHMRNFIELKDKFQKHREEINNWLEVKEKRRLKAEHEAMLNRMATRIQAWWRGTMYRRKLGPYRKKKKKKGKGKQGKGGKGANKKGKRK